MSPRRDLCVCWLAVACLAVSPVLQAADLRVVDSVLVGDLSSEVEHEYAAEGSRSGRDGIRVWREAIGWQRYVLTIFEDTEVTLLFTFRGSQGESRRYALEIDGKPVPVMPFASPSLQPVTIPVRVPLPLTRNRESIVVTLLAIGGPTPAVVQIRTLQEHLEF